MTGDKLRVGGFAEIGYSAFRTLCAAERRVVQQQSSFAGEGRSGERMNDHTGSVKPWQASWTLGA